LLQKAVQITPSERSGRKLRSAPDRRLWIAPSQAVSGTSERRTRAHIARRDATAAPRRHFAALSRRDPVDEGGAYACPTRAHAAAPRRAASTRPPPRTRSSAAASHRAHPACACVRRIDKAPRKSPEKLGCSARVPARTRWSQRWAYAKERDEPGELVAGALLLSAHRISRSAIIESRGPDHRESRLAGWCPSVVARQR